MSGRELCQFDTTLVIGALGGPRQNARSTFALAHNVVSNGGRAALFGRTIFGEDAPIGFVQCLRRVLDGESEPQDAHAPNIKKSFARVYNLRVHRLTDNYFRGF